jgi:hypothetical protein
MGGRRHSRIWGYSHMIRNTTIRALAGVIALCLMTGCATGRYPWSKRTVQSLQSTRAEVVAAERQVVRTIGTLNEIASASGGDLTDLHTRLAEDIKAIEAQAEVARRRADAYRSDAKAYMHAWEKELSHIEDGVSRLQSALRREEVIVAFRHVEWSAARTRQAYGPLLIGLQGIGRDLGENPSPRSVAAMNPRFDNIRAISTALRQRMAILLDELDAVSATLVSQRS